MAYRRRSRSRRVGLRRRSRPRRIRRRMRRAGVRPLRIGYRM